MDNYLLEIRDLSARYKGASEDVLKNINLTMAAGQITCLIGGSGSGKTTLLRAIQGVDDRLCLTGGQITCQGEIGVIFQEPGASLGPIRRIDKQFFDVLHALDRSLSRKEIMGIARESLLAMDFEDPDRILNLCPVELSGGMNQRVAIALATVRRPSLLLADEPTSALDSKTEDQVVEELLAIRQRSGCAILLVTHNIALASRMADQIVLMRDGGLEME